MLVSCGEFHEAKVFKRIENSMEYDVIPAYSFKCRVANQHERSSFQPISGFLTENKGVYLLATRLPIEVKPDDRILFMGNYYLVESVGEYISNARILSSELNIGELKKSFPKGLKIV